MSIVADERLKSILYFLHSRALFASISRMTFFLSVLPWIEITISALLIVCVLLQQSAAGLGGAISGGDSSVSFHTRRGFEKFIFVMTFVLGGLFILSTFAAIFF